MASDGRYMYYDYPYATPPSYEPQRPIRSDSGSSSSQPPHSPVQQHQHHSSQPQFSNQSHNPPQPSYSAPPHQQYAPGPTYMSPLVSTPSQQWTQGSWGQQSYPPPPPPDTRQYNTAPAPPARPASSEQQPRIWNHSSYAPPPPHHHSKPINILRLPHARDRTSLSRGSTRPHRSHHPFRPIRGKTAVITTPHRRMSSRRTTSRSNRITTLTLILSQVRLIQRLTEFVGGTRRPRQPHPPHPYPSRLPSLPRMHPILRQ
ncbi:hypothetical protein B0H17DRAFT_369967 [Mycena rosella]|uniref:Uncharacterized protein n=1 Tax=Mycena rosella TaxID=1033263 RepID=A0AAD7GZX2_MYCRO|nr:hypothetical protein B0H17DRAFT_369967 [Mycena rosella]